MKKILLLLTILIGLTAFSQKQANIWYFGGSYSNQSLRGAGVDFNSGSPVALTNSGMCYTEGCASYCNSAGQLLFYAKGDSVFDKTHSLMLNGDSLGGHWSTMQSTLIVPVNREINQYYLFTNDGHPTSSGAGLFYSVVDMTYNNGLGAVTIKAVPILAETGEQLIGTKHANGTDFWVITADYDSCIFYAFQVSQSGVAPPVITNLGFNEEIRSSLIINPDGDKIAIIGGLNTSYARLILDFNKSTGVITNPDTLMSGNGGGGGAFSPDGNLFYDLISIDSLIQYNLNAPNILASAVGIGKVNGYCWDMKIGPDNRIYIPRSYYLDVIQNPNVIGLGCNYQHNAVFLAGRIAGTRLPNVTLIADTIVGVSELNNDNNDFIITPNPFTNYTTIEFENLKNDPHNIRVFNLQGKLVYSLKNITSGQITIERKNLANGVYIFRLTNDKQIVASGKLLIE